MLKIIDSVGCGINRIFCDYRNTFVAGSLVVVDVIALISAFGLALVTRAFFDQVAPDVWGYHLSVADLRYCWWSPVTFLFFLAYEKVYTQRLPFWDETRNLAKALSVAMIMIIVVITLGKMSVRVSRLSMIFLWSYSLFLFPIARLLGKKVLYRLGIWRENVIILGAGLAGRAVAKALCQDSHLGFNVIGFLDDSPQKIATTVEVADRRYKVFGRVKNFTRFVRALNISSVVIAIPSLPPEELTALTNTVQKYTKHVLVVPDLKGMSLLNTELCHLFLQQMFLLKINNNLKSPFSRFVKRVFDVVFSFLLLPFVFPLVVMIGLLIKIDSAGPALFVQYRLGKKGIFKCLKFRTMHVNSDKLLTEYLASNSSAREEWKIYKKLRHDPRVTRIGRFLRKTSLDELPQLFNVLMGNMSLIGPRPYMPEEKKDLGDSVDTILLINPGISGLWQVSGRNELTFEDRIKLDTWYILNWSPWFDIMILFKTIGVVIRRQGAY